jgi:uncharacterized glyoxalase superfamily protein PhnB
MKKYKLKQMTQMNSYLTFNGNCREAMHFYKDCLGRRTDATNRWRIADGG